MLQDTLQGERRERQLEREAQAEKDREAVLTTRFKEMENNHGELTKKIDETIMLIRTEGQQAAQAAKDTDTQKLGEEVRGLRDQLDGDRQARLEELLVSLKDDKTKMEGDVSQLRAQIAEGATGRTTEDLIVQIGPLMKDAADNAGDRIVGELRGLRESAADGRLPTLVAQRPAEQPTAQTPTQTAQQIGQRVSLENRIIENASKGR